MKHRAIKINGRVLDGPIMIDDPDCKRVILDRDLQRRNIRYITYPGNLKNYLKKHPEGIILAGYRIFFFEEPFLVYPGMVIFDASGSADIRIRERAEEVDRQLEHFEKMRSTAADAFWNVSGEHIS